MCHCECATQQKEDDKTQNWGGARDVNAAQIVNVALDTTAEALCVYVCSEAHLLAAWLQNFSVLPICSHN